jgi:hypothetical protein
MMARMDDGGETTGVAWTGGRVWFIEKSLIFMKSIPRRAVEGI